MLRAPLIYLSQQNTLRQLLMGHRYSRRLALRFVAGETIGEAIAAVRRLNEAGATATLDYLGENASAADDTRRAAAAYVTALARIGGEGVKSNVSIKLTHMGLDISPDLCRENVLAILHAASERDNFVRIDMEGSAYTGRTLALHEELWQAGHRNLGVVIQSYLYRSQADVERMIDLGTRVRLVKGAYNEPASVAYPRKSDVDENFRSLSAQLLERGFYPAIATHDEKLIKWTTGFAAQRGISRDRFEFQLLYGIRRDLLASLVRDGYNVRVYVPYGSEWYPYLMRRIAERPANLVFVLGNLLRG